VSIRESHRNRRDRWPLEFDLAGVPRETAERERLLREQRELEETEQSPMSPVTPSPTNMFAVDYQAGEHVIDINNPPTKRYVHQEFPKLVYHHESGHILQVDDEKQLKAAQKRGFKDRPASNRDYSKIAGSVAAIAEHAEPRPEELSADEMVELDDEAS
jgi:hypothetical protein